MKRRTIVCLTAVMILSMSLLTANSWAKYETIPPEILQQYDPQVVSEERPAFVILTNSDIWNLRETPTIGGDLVLLQLDHNTLSSPQIEIIRNWVKEGARVFLKWVYFRDLNGLLFEIPTKWIQHAKLIPNKNHPVNTDVRLIHDGSVFFVTNLPQDSSVIIAVQYKISNAAIGVYKYGKGYVYFDGIDRLRGTDRDRFTLNLNQWLIGKKVPGAATTEVFGAPSPKVPETEELKIYDLLTLRNGDNLSGTILNESFTIQTTYATLSFPKDEIKRILFESEQADIQIMELLRGDILRGVIQDEIINIDIPSAGKTPIEQDKIREINFAKKQTTQ